MWSWSVDTEETMEAEEGMCLSGMASPESCALDASRREEAGVSRGEYELGADDGSYGGGAVWSMWRLATAAS